MRTTKLIYYLAAALLLPACSNESDDPALDSRVPLTVQGEIVGAQTRVALNEDGSGKFVKDDVIYVSKSGERSLDADYKNIKYVYDGTSFVPENPSEVYHFNMSSSSDVTFVAGNVKIDDDIIDLSDQSEALFDDVLFASGNCNFRSPKLSLKFVRKNARLTLNFSSPIKSCSLKQILYRCQLQFDGIFYTGPGDWTYDFKLHVDDTGYKAEAIFPLKLMVGTDRTITLTVVDVNDHTYTGNIRFDGDSNYSGLSANTNYVFNITLPTASD